MSNISQKNSQLLEKSVRTIHEDKNTLFHKQVHLQIKKSPDDHRVEVLKNPEMKIHETQAKEFIDLSKEENMLTHEHVYLQAEKSD